MTRILLIFVVLFCVPSWGFNAGQIVNRPYFHRMVKAHETFKPVPESVLRDLQVGQLFWGELAWLRPGQARYSFDLAVHKLLKWSAVDNPIAHLLEFQKILSSPTYLEKPSVNCLLSFHDHQSLLPESNSVEVALSDHGLILVDGHHHVMASFAADAKMVAMRVRFDFRGLGRVDLYQKLLEEKAIHPYGFNRASYLPEHFHQLVDDPNRYLVSLLTASVHVRPDGTVARIKSKAKQRYPVMLKYRPGARPFQEMDVSDFLHQQGIHYKSVLYGSKVPAGLRETVRKLLLNAQERGELSFLPVVPKRVEKTAFPFDVLVDEYQKACGGVFH